MSTALTKREKLTPAERRDLKACIATVKAAKWALMDAAEALQEARQRKLYREQYSTFEEFCHAEFGMERAHAYRLLDAGKVFERLQCLPRETLPTSERQVRPLTALPVPQQAEAWKLAVQHAGGGQPTGKQVAFAAQLVTGKPANPPTDRTSSESSPLSLATPALEAIRRLSPANQNEKAALEILLAEVQRRLSQNSQIV